MRLADEEYLEKVALAWNCFMPCLRMSLLVRSHLKEVSVDCGIVPWWESLTVVGHHAGVLLCCHSMQYAAKRLCRLGVATRAELIVDSFTFVSSTGHGRDG